MYQAESNIDCKQPITKLMAVSVKPLMPYHLYSQIINKLEEGRLSAIPGRHVGFSLPWCCQVIKSDNGSEFTAEVISELNIIWPKLALVHGKPRHPQSQGSVVAWLGDNNTTDWSIGIKFVQKISSLHAGIRRSPNAAMFGCEAKVGLTSSSRPDEVIQRMQCEEDLLAVLTTGQNGEEPGPVPRAKSAEVHFDTEPGEPLDNAAVPIPLVDRGRGDPRNILGVVWERDQNDMYTTGVKAGVLKANKV
ncbi:uncharacterized protein LOC134779416 [Penaeus indicus]|uniref:uncharacterized protein LOC134779416 n=1 Tax=Penaeus indicus TaxID=29960 RepID=UPI00300C9BBB